MSNCYDHELKMNMLDTYYFNNKNDAEENLNKNLEQFRKWYEDEIKKYINAIGNFDNWYEEYTGMSFDKMLKEEDEYR